MVHRQRARELSASTALPPFRIATRESRLALWQAEHVASILRARFPERSVELVGMTTTGDQVQDRPLSEIGGKGLFTKELELALFDGRADLAVHSLKDVPMELPEGFMLSTVLEREDPRDAFVSNNHQQIDALPDGAVVGTSSLRRAAQLKERFPHLRVEPLRGNLDTRLRKLDSGQYDGIVLACAGLIRLGLESRIRSRIDPASSLPAPGQGAVAIEVMKNRPELIETLSALTHQPTWLATIAERAVSRVLGGNCRTPLAAFAQWQGKTKGEAKDQTLHLRGLLALDDGRIVRAEVTRAVATTAEADAMGIEIAQQLRDAGAPAVPH